MKKIILILSVFVFNLTFGQFGEILNKLPEILDSKETKNQTTQPEQKTIETEQKPEQKSKVGEIVGEIIKPKTHAKNTSTIGNVLGLLSNKDISGGLKQALNQGVTTGIAQLGKKDGFLTNQAVKILFPQELEKVDKTLRKLGMSSLADEGLKVLNRAAEDAVSKATPIFTKVIANMSINDASNILLGEKNAATNYLRNSTTESLKQSFAPQVQQSFNKVGADKIWKNLITKYNSIPLISKVNPDLTEYVTEQAISGVFKMVEEKEAGIRGNVSQRTTPLLKKVFKQQDLK